MPACSIPIGYVHKICILTFLTYWVKDSLGMLEVSLGSMILLKSARGDDFELAWSFDDVWLTEEGVAYMGIFWWYVVHWGTTFHRGKYYLLFSHKSLRIDFDSTLKGLLQNSIGEIFFCNSRGSYFCALDLQGVRLWYWIYLGFSWWYWLIEECPWWFLVHWEILNAFDPLGNNLDDFDLLIPYFVRPRFAWTPKKKKKKKNHLLSMGLWENLE